MRRLLFISILFALPALGHACDICGCFMGVIPYDNQSSFGVFHRYRVFNGYSAYGQRSYLFPAASQYLGRGFLQESSGGRGHVHVPGQPHAAGQNPRDYEIYRVVELRARWFVHPRAELQALLPWVMNDANTDGSYSQTSGMGDITLLAGYHLIRPSDTLRLKQRLVVGGGVKLPTGNYYAQDSEGQRIDYTLQPGSGTTDLLTYVAYQLGYRKWVLSANAQLKHSSRNYYQESYAPGLTANLQMGRQYRLGAAWQVVPTVQAYFENTQGERFRGELLGEHQMQALLGGVGVDVFYKNVQLTAQVHLPVAEQATTHPQNAGRIALGLTYNLKQSRFLLGGK